MSEEARRRWLEERRRLERRMAEHGRRQSPFGEKTMTLARVVMPLTKMAVAASGLAARGRANAQAPRLTRHDFRFPDLPPAFDGYRILLATDLHVGNRPEAIHAAAGLARQAMPDLLLLGGDYQDKGWPSAAEAGHLMAPLLDAVAPPDGILAVLGNHDRHDMAAVLERRGVRLLLNEWAELRRGGDAIALYGADDVHAFCTGAAAGGLAGGEGFRLALIHSVDLATAAAEAGIRLYLAGHTHGGQICLPGGRPLLTALDSHRRLAKGAWEWRGMAGYTSAGVGASDPAVRFNCPGEVALIVLRR